MTELPASTAASAVESASVVGFCGMTVPPPPRVSAIVTAEEGLAAGGLGGAVAEYCADHHPVRVKRLGFPGFLPTGSPSWLMERYGLTAEGIAAAARDLVTAKSL